MIRVEITKEGFMNGRNRVHKGEIIEVAPPIARYIVRNDEGKIVEEVTIVEEVIPKKKVVKKKSTYKTRDMKAE